MYPRLRCGLAWVAVRVDIYWAEPINGYVTSPPLDEEQSERAEKYDGLGDAVLAELLGQRRQNRVDQVHDDQAVDG